MEDNKTNSEDQIIEITYNTPEEGSYEYAREKLGVAVWKLATGIEGIKSRLADAYLELVILQEDDFPFELREQWHAILNELTRGKLLFSTEVKKGEIVRVSVGQPYSTLRYMRKKRAKRIAQQICELEARLDDYSWRKPLLEYQSQE